MAGTSLLALLDDIALILDDIAVMTKVAAKKTAGVLGDDLALNAEQVSGVKADRELPVVWAIAKGSFINKLILVPAALAISAFLPWLITPLLMIGGAYLCFEGFEKVAHKFLHAPEEDHEHHIELVNAVSNPEVDLVEFEKKKKKKKKKKKNKIKGAIRTDFILSAEIIVIALGTVKEAAFMNQVAVVSLISLLMTVGVYSLVAGIVKIDDAGLKLLESANAFKQTVGKALLKFAPVLMKTLSIVGTAAMFLVGGGILVHGIPAAHHWVEHMGEAVSQIAAVGPVLAFLVPTLLNGIGGIIAGGLVLAVVAVVKKAIPQPSS